MRVDAASWTRFEVNNLAVVPSVLGRKHLLRFERKNVQISLPSRQHLNRGRRYEERLICVGWQHINGRRMPRTYVIYNVDVSISIPKQLVIPKTMLSVSPKRPELTTPNKASFLDNIADEYQEIAKRALDYWVRVMRWQTGRSEIGQPLVVREEIRRGTYLIDNKTCHRFWANNFYVIAMVSEGIPLIQWKKIQNTLTRAQEPPVWFDFLDEASQKYTVGEYSGSVLSAAISCETLLRKLFASQITGFDFLDSNIVEIISRLNINDIIRKLKRFDFWDSRCEANIKINDLQNLFGLRNRIVHGGKQELATRELSGRHLKTARTFVTFADGLVEL